MVEPGLRSLRPGDAVALLELWNAAARFDPMTRELMSEKVWEDPGFDPELALVCEDGGAIAGFGMAVIRETTDGRRGVIKLLAVGEPYRHRGIGGRLLGRLEASLLARGAEVARVCESPPNYLVPGVDMRCVSADHFFQQQGYRPTGSACNLSVDLEGRSFDCEDQEKVLAENGIECRRSSMADRVAIDDLLDPNWPAWRAEVAAGLENSPPTVHIGLREGRVLGFAAWDANNRGTGWFGPMGTAPQARGLGIGQVLLWRCLSDMQAAGLAEAVIPWVDPVGFYEKCAGAVVSRTFNRYQKVLKT